MKILILSCNTGQGHNSVANAIAEMLDARKISWQMEDALSFVSDRTSKFMSWGHSFLYCHCPEVFQVGYEVAERHPQALSEGSVAYRFFARGADDLYEFCRAHEFDTVICTHVFAALMLTEVQRTHELPVKSYFVATDYTSYPGVQDSQMDVYFIPDDRLRDAYGDKFTVTSGIPVYQQFFQAMDKAEAKQALGLSPWTRHILIMCGSMGCGPMEEIAQQIAGSMADDCVVSIICGTNRRLYRKLTEEYRDDPRVQIYGFVHDVHKMMASADIYVTKPGGISTTEAMAQGLPMVLVDAVAGCEDYNMDYFREMGSAEASKDPKRLAQLCLELIANTSRREEMAAQLLKNRKNGARIICDYLQEHAN